MRVPRNKVIAFVLIVFLVRHPKWYRCESKIAWARHPSVQPHNHQKNSKKYRRLQNDLFHYQLIFGVATHVGRFFFTPQERKKNKFIFGASENLFSALAWNKWQGLHFIIIISLALPMISIRVRTKKITLNEREGK